MQVPEARCAFRIRLEDILVAARANRLWAGCISAGGRCVVVSWAGSRLRGGQACGFPVAALSGPGGMAVHIWCKRFCVF